jgi:cytolysin-activating lysine-acyltransferase
MNTTANSTTTAKQSADMNVEDMTKLAELAKEQAKLVMGKIPLLGPVTWLMMQQGA